MDEHRQNYNDPWDDGVYETGRTRPPKSHGSFIAMLLILVIFLFGITSALNVRIFQELNEGGDGNSTAISFTSSEDAADASLSTEPSLVPSEPLETQDVTIDLVQTPQSLPNTASQEGSLSWQAVYEQNIPSVVSITCSVGSGSSSGTGVILSESGYIVTNSHVVEDAVEITVLLSDDRSFSAQLVGADAVSDLAVLHIDAQDLTPASFGDSASLRVGDEVVAIGDPLGVELRGTMTDGIISAINRDVTVDGRSMTLIQTNAALNSGNSGGPLINCYGQVIGINTMKISAFTDDAGVEGLGFAIPSSTVKEIVDELIHNGYVSGRPTLGLTCEELSSLYLHYYRLPEGLYISGVTTGSPAAEVGISQGDVLISVDGTRTTSVDTLNSILYSHSVGDTVTVVIYRSGRQYSVDLTLAEAKG